MFDNSKRNRDDDYLQIHQCWSKLGLHLTPVMDLCIWTCAFSCTSIIGSDFFMSILIKCLLWILTSDCFTGVTQGRDHVSCHGYRFADPIYKDLCIQKEPGGLWLRATVKLERHKVLRHRLTDCWFQAFHGIYYQLPNYWTSPPLSLNSILKHEPMFLDKGGKKSIT